MIKAGHIYSHKRGPPYTQCNAFYLVNQIIGQLGHFCRILQAAPCSRPSHTASSIPDGKPDKYCLILHDINYQYSFSQDLP